MDEIVIYMTKSLCSTLKLHENSKKKKKAVVSVL